MVNKIMEIMVLIILCSLIIVNEIGKKKSQKRRDAISWMHMRKVVLGISDNDTNISKDLFPNESILKMHNSGTKLSEEIDKLKFVSTANQADYFG